NYQLQAGDRLFLQSRLVPADQAAPPKEPARPAEEKAQEMWASKLFEETSWDFGNCKRGDTLKHRFKITNIYQVPIELTSVRVGCGAVTCSLSRHTLQPRETGYLE